jgi:glycosyltransferase involved in cell wall biosynthesis
MNKITVLFLIDVLQELGGAEKNLTQIVLGLNPDKYNTIICCLKGGRVYEELKEKDINVINLNLQKIYTFDALLKGIKLIRIIKKNKVKIMVTYFDSSDFFGSIIGKIAGVRLLISSRRDVGFNLKKRHIWAYRIINRLFDKIIAVSENVKEKIINRENADPNKVITIYNGVDISDSNGFDSEKIKKSLGLDSNNFIITMLANLTPVKGHKYLLAAASEVIKRNNLVKFLLIGTGKDGFKQELQDLTYKLGIENDVVFAGFRSDISEILSIADITVLSSTSEGFSNAILEYMAADKPVVATDVGGNRELVIEGKTGFLVPPSNPNALSEAILKLLNDAVLREEMSKNGRTRVKDYFSREKMVKNIDALFENLINEKILSRG